MSPSVCYDTDPQRHKSKEAHQHKTKSKEPQRHIDTQAHTNTDIDTNTKRHTDTQRPGPTSQVDLRHLAQLLKLVPLAARLRLPPSDPMQTWQADNRSGEIAKRNCGTKPKHNNTTPKHTTETTTQGHKQKPKANTHTHTHTAEPRHRDTETPRHSNTETLRHRDTGTHRAAIQAESVHGWMVDNQR